jgi:hypothetical protein
MRATREQLGTISNMGTEQQGNVREREREGREREMAKTTKRSCENFEFCRESLAAAIAHFFFVFVFVLFLVFSFSWFSYRLRAVCCTVCVSFCVCFWRGRYFEFVILALLFSSMFVLLQIACVLEERGEGRRILNVILHTHSSGRHRNKERES